MLNKLNLKVAQFASKDASRYAQQGILVRQDATVATNGHYLAWVSRPTQFKPADFPCVDGAPTPQESHTPFILPTDAAKTIEKALPRKVTIPVLANAAVAVEEGKPAITVTDLENPQVFRPHAVEGTFPNFECVIPAEKPAFVIALSAEYLAQIAKFAADFRRKDDRTCDALRISFYGDKGGKPDNTRAVRFDITTKDDDQGMTAMLMPMRIDATAALPHTYGWKPEETEKKTAA